MDKTNFILYKDYQDHVNLLSDEQAGKLFKAIFKYVDGRNETKLDGMTSMAFSFIKANLERDLKKYKERVETAKVNGAKGGRPKKPTSKPKKPKEPSGFNNKPKKAVIVIDNVIVTVNDTDIDTDIIKQYTSDLELTKSIAGFISMRKKIKKPLINEGLEKLFKKLNSFASTDIEKCKILDESTMNSWQGIFELKDKNKKQGGTSFIDV